VDRTGRRVRVTAVRPLVLNLPVPTLDAQLP
jgi:hypothetical protein